MTPQDFTTLIEMLEYRATTSPEKLAFTFGGQNHSYSDVWTGITKFAAQLILHGSGQGDKVVLALSNGPDFFSAFYGIQRAGGTAVPVFPGYGPDRIVAICDLCGAKTVVVSAQAPPSMLKNIRAIASDHSISVVTIDELPTSLTAAEEAVRFPPVLQDDIAFVQYTSGSTGDPKGVQISHANLLTNMRQMIEGMEITRQDVFVSWLPVYHDMGLILKTMVPFYLGIDLHLLPSSLMDVSAWLTAIQKNKATFTAAPDFAYRMCLRKIANPDSFDLSSLRVALNAAEPVRCETITGFETAFGLAPTMVAAYGLAEATVGVSMWPPGTLPKIDAHGHISVGSGFPDVGISIVEGEKKLGLGAIGEIAIKSTALPIGYLENPIANEALFWRPDWVLSGDLGYLDEDGDLFVVGRKKNTIKMLGRTVFPQEIQEAVDQHPSVRYSAAIGVDKGRIDGEQVYIFAEVEATTMQRADLEAISIDIVRRFHSQLGYRPGRLYLVKPKTIPMTYNGKVRQADLKKEYLSGNMVKRGQILFPDY